MVARHRQTNAANMELLTKIQQLKGEHPYWGYRRIWAYLFRRKQFAINRKRVYRLMKENNLLVPKNRKLIAPRSATTHKPKTHEPNRYWGIDMTKIMLPTQGWIYLHVVIDWGSKKLLSAYPSLTSKSGDWLIALNEAINRQFPQGIKDAEFKPALVSDHGCQPTSKAFKDACAEVEIQQIFASYSNPKGNAETERMMRTIKEDLVWPREFTSFAQFKSALTDWIRAYNEDYPHSSIGYMTPYEYERWYQASVA